MSKTTATNEADCLSSVFGKCKGLYLLRAPCGHVGPDPCAEKVMKYLLHWVGDAHVFTMAEFLKPFEKSPKKTPSPIDAIRPQRFYMLPTCDGKRMPEAKAEATSVAAEEVTFPKHRQWSDSDVAAMNVVFNELESQTTRLEILNDPSRPDGIQLIEVKENGNCRQEHTASIVIIKRGAVCDMLLCGPLLNLYIHSGNATAGSSLAPMGGKGARLAADVRYTLTRIVDKHSLVSGKVVDETLAQLREAGHELTVRAVYDVHEAYGVIDQRSFCVSHKSACNFGLLRGVGEKQQPFIMLMPLAVAQLGTCVLTPQEAMLYEVTASGFAALLTTAMANGRVRPDTLIASEAMSAILQSYSATISPLGISVTDVIPRAILGQMKNLWGSVHHAPRRNVEVLGLSEATESLEIEARIGIVRITPEGEEDEDAISADEFFPWIGSPVVLTFQSRNGLRGIARHGWDACKLELNEFERLKALLGFDANAALESVSGQTRLSNTREYRLFSLPSNTGATNAPGCRIDVDKERRTAVIQLKNKLPAVNVVMPGRWHYRVQASEEFLLQGNAKSLWIRRNGKYYDLGPIGPRGELQLQETVDMFLEKDPSATHVINRQEVSIDLLDFERWTENKRESYVVHGDHSYKFDFTQCKVIMRGEMEDEQRYTIEVELCDTTPLRNFLTERNPPVASVIEAQCVMGELAWLMDIVSASVSRAISG